MSCGIDKEPHYDEEKTFGRDPVVLPLSNPTPMPPPPILPAPPTETPAPSPEPGVEEPPLTTGRDMLGSFKLLGYFDSRSASRIVRGSGSDGEVVNDGLLDPALKGLLALLTRDDSHETLDMTIQENGYTRASVVQKAHTANGDFLSGLIGAEGQSGTQTLDWALAQDSEERECPQPFICVDRILWKPEQGKTWTYCFSDRDSNKSLAVPYAPNPQFGLDAFKDTIPSEGRRSKTFWMTSHPGLVSCEDPQRFTWRRDLFQWKLSLGDKSATRQRDFLKKAIHKPLKVDAEVVVEFGLFNPDLNRTYQPKGPPFIDQISRLNTKTRYFISTANHTFVKIERTVQTPLELSLAGVLTTLADDRGGLLSQLITGAATGLRELFSSDSSTTGLQVNYLFEFCGHKAASGDLYDHCTGRVVR